MTVNLICQAVIPYASMLPTDVITNTWSFRDFTTNTDYQAAADVLNPFVQAFYDTLYGTSPNYLASGAAWEARWYNRDDPPPRAPYILPLRTTSTTQVATEIPAECAAVLSFQGVPLSGFPQSRRRGRVFLGGLTDAAVANSSSSGAPTLDLSYYSAVAEAAEDLLSGVEGAGDYMWTVWSTANNSYVQVVDGWIDNAVDTQRRRGQEASVRYVWPTP